MDTSRVDELAPGVFVVPDSRAWLVPNVGVVVGRDAALVIDTGLGPDNGQAVLDLARSLAPGRELILTTTHFHPEHGFGAQAFAGRARILASRAQADELSEKGEHFLRLFRQVEGPGAVAALEGVRLVPPTEIYEGASRVLDLGGRTVELRPQGAAHTRGDQTVLLPAEGILFAGDLVEEGMFPIFPWFPPGDMDVDAVRWRAALRAMNARVIVPGHGATGGQEVAAALADHMDAVERDVQALLAEGLPREAVLAEVKALATVAQPGWEHPFLLDMEVGYFLDTA